MNRNKIKVLGLLGLPLLAVAIAVMVFALSPTTNTTTTEAAVDGAAMTLTCPTNVARDSDFKCSVSADAIPTEFGYVLAQTYIVFSDNVDFVASATTWGDCDVAVSAQGVGFASLGCLTGLTPADQFGSQIKGEELFTFTLHAPDAKKDVTVQMIGVGNPPAGTSGASYKTFETNVEIPVPDGPVIDIAVKNPPTATPTSTPPPIPKMSKCDQTDNFGSDPDNGPDGIKDAGPCGSLVNHFLQRQGTKIPPADCLAGTPTQLAEKLSQGIVSPDPKAENPFQVLGAFEFEVHYDNKKVCVDLTAGTEFAGNGIKDGSPGPGICIVEDDDPTSKPQLEGVARIGCVTVGKSDSTGDCGTEGFDRCAVNELVPLALIDIYPQPEVYSQAKPNQDNGVVVQINNVNCDLGDEQGHAIPIFSCDDVDITFRYLEGDVEPDCSIDATDAQAIAFRWGVEKGSLIYKDFMNLEPSSQQADNDIDINDLQFVFGRFGSTCKDPHPAQDPVNPKL